MIANIAQVGIIFLLFLLGLNLSPESLWSSFKNTTEVTIVSSVVFCGFGILIAHYAGFALADTFLIGAAMIFSSTIIGLKLLPTTVLHNQRLGELIISVLLLQDIIAIALIMMFKVDFSGSWYVPIGTTLIGLPLVIMICLLLERYILVPLMNRFNSLQEYIFLLAIGWCLGISELSYYFGLSHELGAFIAGITLATSKISQYIAFSLNPLRDFFLVLFFFALGASFNVQVLPQIWLISVLLAGVILVVKPFVFRFLFSA